MNTHPTYYTQGPMGSQDGRPVWAVVRAVHGCMGRLLALQEHISEASAKRAAQALNEAAQRPQTTTDAPA
jgi:hypothetical protein